MMLPWESPPASGNLQHSHCLIQSGGFVLQSPWKTSVFLDFVQSTLLSQKIISCLLQHGIDSYESRAAYGQTPSRRREGCCPARDGQHQHSLPPGQGKGPRDLPARWLLRAPSRNGAGGRSSDMDGKGCLSQVPSSPAFCPCSELWQDPWSWAEPLDRGTVALERKQEAVHKRSPRVHQHPELEDSPNTPALTLNFSFTSRSSESSSNSF